MNPNNQQRHIAHERGLILLVVLSMLTLFSLLAISYVIFSGQSRSANFGIARRDFHGMRPGEVIDVAMKQALRGTVDNLSAVGPHSLLADLYGHAESIGNPTTPGVSYLLFQARQLPGATPPETPELLAGRFLRIPLYEGNDITPMRGGSVVQSSIPDEDDALTGRVLSFLEGPLAGESFRIVRSIGSSPPATFAALRRSVVIDLDDAGEKTSGISAAFACVNPTSGVGYRLWINARELNGLGYGIPYNFDGQSVSALETSTSSRIPMNLQPGLNPNRSYIPTPPTLPGLEGQIAAANASAFSTGSFYASDSDESYDAPDVNDFYLAHTRSPLTVPDAASNGLPGQDIIPSFHRAALINYIINREEDLDDTSVFTKERFVSLLDDIQGACARPLAITVLRLDSGGSSYVSANPFFDSNNTALSSATLTLDLGGSWNNWTSNGSKEKFLAWARMLTGGPWDVDNNGDGINDSVWVDLDLPMITSPEGKLLKMMAAYYIEDLDNRLDLNAVGNLSQQLDDATNDPAYGSYSANVGINNNYSQPNTQLPQGLGVGPAESTLRHLFANDAEWKTFLFNRYGGAVGSTPGSGTLTSLVDDMRSQLNGGALVFNPSVGGLRNAGTRSKRRDVSHSQLPGLPTAVRGDYALGLDRLGNPRTLRGNYLPSYTPDEGTDDPYESRVASTPHHDSPFTIAEWERMYRRNDWDRSTFPHRLQQSPLINGDINNVNINFVTPRSAHTRHVPLATTSSILSPLTNAPLPVTNFHELLISIGQFRRPTQVAIPTAAYTELFPLEFKRGVAMDLNRPFGNGTDDDLDGSIDEPEELLKGGSLFDGAGSFNPTVRQQALYVSGNVGPSGVGEFPTGIDTNGIEFTGYLGGNIDPPYEKLVFDGNNGDNTARQTANYHHGQQSRQLMARHLYCLAMLLLPDPIYQTYGQAGIPALTGDERARVIAQWVVNIIDFRDADHAMTRFAYDPDPFTQKPGGNFWVPNPDLSDATHPHRVGYVVWGLEQPELLLTETGAMHDLRIKDTAEDSSGKRTDDMMAPDSDYDQYRLPQGSLFLELMCPRSSGRDDIPADNSLAGAATPADPASTPNSFYTINNHNVVLNLGALSPSDGTTTYPVWRVAISAPQVEDDDPTANKILLGMATNSDGAQVFPNEVSYQLTDPAYSSSNGLAYDRPMIPIDPLDPNRRRQPLPSPSIDRIVWFTDLDPSINVIAAAVGLHTSIADNDKPAHVYFNENGTGPLLAGGQYMVVGPRTTTYFGSKITSESTHFNEPNDHRIDLQANWADLYTSPNSLVNRRPAAMRDIVHMNAVTTPPWDVSRLGSSTPNLPPWIELNVSEPHPTDTGYYPEPTFQLNSTDGTGDTANGALGFRSLPRDSYHDYATSTGNLPTKPFDHEPGTPIYDLYRLKNDESGAGSAGVAAPGTQADWCTAYLQRLADPERPYHGTFNPYITVDWMPIDLTVFSGEATIMDTAAPPQPIDFAYKFDFRSKNGSMKGNPTGRGRTFLSYWNDAAGNPPTTDATGVFFAKQLPVDTGTPGLRPTPSTTNFTTLGYLNSSFELLDDFAPSSTVDPKYVGVPITPPASLAWANRDFASPYELMLVPLSSPGQLMQEFYAPLNANEVQSTKHYFDPQTENVFQHLPNFFQQAADPTGTAGASPPHAFTAATLLELVTTPSPWADSEKVIPPASIDPINNLNPSGRYVLGPLLPPYNRLQTMREPGRVNINTVEDMQVWRGVEWNYLNNSPINVTTNPANRSDPTTSLAFIDLKKSRHQYLQPHASSGTEQIGTKRNQNLDGNYPTEFPGVFKSTLSAGRVPATRTTPGVLDQPANVTPAMATLFRQHPDAVANNVFRPLFSPRPDLLSSAPNPQSEYLPFSRLANLTTTRSNVFAVRVTVGYFEVDTSTGIGPEYGWDNGQSRRHRGFYVIDRSIPVAYEPGQDLNTDRCVLIRRIVE